MSQKPSALESPSLDDLAAGSRTRPRQKAQRPLSLAHRGLVVDTSHVTSLGGAGKRREKRQRGRGALGKRRRHAGRGRDAAGHGVGVDHGGRSHFDGRQRVDVSAESGQVSRGRRKCTGGVDGAVGVCGSGNHSEHVVSSLWRDVDSVCLCV